MWTEWPAGAPRSRQDDWLRNDLPLRFAGRLLGIDAATADAWGRLIARRERDGRPMGARDGWIAATAEVHGLTLVTGDVADFAGALERIANPCPTSNSQFAEPRLILTPKGSHCRGLDGGPTAPQRV